VRHNDREKNVIRPISFERGVNKHASGSVFVKLGDTHVLVTATCEEKVPRHLHGKGQGWVTAEYNMLPSATAPRNQRERFKVSGRTQEIQRLIGRSLRACVDMVALGERSITIDADVIQADGGTRTTSITAGYIALYDALASLKEQELIQTIPLKFPLAAISVGVVDGVALLDLDYSEDSTADVDANVVMNDRGEIIEFQTSSECAPLPKETLTELLHLGEVGTNFLVQAQKEALGLAFISATY